MGILGWLTGSAIPNGAVESPPSVGPGHRPGDPDGVVFEGEDTFSGQRAAIVPSPWDGWPAEWVPPNWDHGRFSELVDTAWACIDLNSSVLSAMPVYRTRGGQVLPPTVWMTNPDPDIYTSWQEFARQVFWDYQAIGEVFVMPTMVDSNGFPSRFRVIPPWLVNVEMGVGRRVYNIGSLDVTGEILHIRYKSSTDAARGIGPLESGRYRIIAAGVLARYAAEIARQGGIPHYVLEVERRLSTEEREDIQDQWFQNQIQNLARPPVLHGGIKAHQLQLTPTDLGLTDLAAFNEARIATLLGVPPFLVGLPSGGDSMTYSNATSLFDFHDRRFVKPAATAVMNALSGWALPRGQQAELNRDEYTRPTLKERAESYATLHGIQDETGRAISAGEVRTMERLKSADSAGGVSDDATAAEALTGGGTS